MQRSQDRILDEYLAASARAGDRAALEELGRRWEKRLVRHAWRLTGDVEQARDVAQDAWVDIAKGVRRLDDCATFPAFAYRIVTRRAADWVRRAKRRRLAMATLAAESGSASAGNDAAEALASAGAVNTALATLPAGQRAAIALFYLEDMSVAEVAVALGIPTGTVKTRLKAARDRLRTALGITTEDGEGR